MVLNRLVSTLKHLILMFQKKVINDDIESNTNPDMFRLVIHSKKHVKTVSKSRVKSHVELIYQV